MLQLQQEEEAKATSAKSPEEAAKKNFEFWNTQPVPKIDEEITTNEAITPDIPLEKLRQDPYSLPAGFEWDTLNIDDPLVVNKLYRAFSSLTNCFFNKDNTVRYYKLGLNLKYVKYTTKSQFFLTAQRTVCPSE